jgi:hypothetical protein
VDYRFEQQGRRPVVAIAAILGSGLMAAASFIRNSRRVRITRWSSGQPGVWLERHDAPAYRLPGYCFGSAEPLKHAFRQRGIVVD